MRLFVAVNFEDSFKKAILDYQGELKRAAFGGDFSRPMNLHLTLAFIGEVRDPAAALRAVRSVRVESFTLKLGKGGRFGNLFWIGAESEGKTEALAAALRDALRREGVPFDTKPFRAHITVAREVEGAEDFRGKIPAASMTVTRISLMKSERINGKLTYTEIQ